MRRYERQLPLITLIYFRLFQRPLLRAAFEHFSRRA